SSLPNVVRSETPSRAAPSGGGWRQQARQLDQVWPEDFGEMFRRQRPAQGPECLDDRTERHDLAADRQAATFEDEDTGRGCVRRHFVDEPGLPNAGLARDDKDRLPAISGRIQTGL